MTYEPSQWTSTPKPVQSNVCREITPDVSCVETFTSYLGVTQPDAISLDVTSLLENTLEMKQDTLENKQTSCVPETSQNYENTTLTNLIQQQTQKRLDQEATEETKRKEELLIKIGDYLHQNTRQFKKTKLHKRLVKKFSSRNIVKSLFKQKTTKENKRRKVEPKLYSGSDFTLLPGDATSRYKFPTGLSVFDVTSYTKNGNKCTWC